MSTSSATIARRLTAVLFSASLFGMVGISYSKVGHALLSPLSSGALDVRPAALLTGLVVVGVSIAANAVSWPDRTSWARGAAFVALLSMFGLCGVVASVLPDGRVTLGWYALPLVELNMRPETESYEAHLAHCGAEPVGVGRVAVRCAEGRVILPTGPLIQARLVGLLNE